MYVLTTSSLCNLLAHVLVQGRHDHATLCIVHVAALTIRNRTALGVADSENEHVDAFLLGSFGSLECPTLVVFTIGNKDDGAPNLLLLCKAVGSQRERTTHIGTLHVDERRRDVLQEHFCRHIVACDRQLHKGIAGKHHQANLVVGEMVYQILDEHLTLLQT